MLLMQPQYEAHLIARKERLYLRGLELLDIIGSHSDSRVPDENVLDADTWGIRLSHGPPVSSWIIVLGRVASTCRIGLATVKGIFDSKCSLVFYEGVQRAYPFSY
jgi:hypothetical protein